MAWIQLNNDVATSPNGILIDDAFVELLLSKMGTISARGAAIRSMTR
jgi:hypothetical protein